MPKSRKILTAVLAAILVIGILPLGPLSGLFNDVHSFKVSAQETAEEEKPLITIGTIGDPHTDYGLQDVEPYIRTSYITAMEALKAEGIDLLLVGGDMTSDNEASLTTEFRWDTDVYDRTISQYHKYSSEASKTGKTLWACGNHDYEVGVLLDGTMSDGDYDAYKGFTDMMVEDCGEPISVYTQDDDPYYGGDYANNFFPDYWLGAHYNIEGFDFIVINAPYKRSTFYSAGVLSWLDTTLSDIGADKTVFIVGHYPLYDNRGLHSLADGLKGSNYTNFVNVLNKYDNAIYLYGHEHGGRATNQLCDTIYSSVDSFERITHYDSNGVPVTSRGINPTSFLTAFMGSASFYNYSLNPNWLSAETPEIIQAMTITVYKDRIEFKVINCGEQTGQLAEPFVWTMKRDVLNSGDVVIPESPETWDLPMNWSVGTERDDNDWDIPVMGNWSISGFSNLDTATTTYQASSKTTEELKGIAATDSHAEGAPQPYLGNNYNETIVQGKDVVANGTNGWYVNNSYRWSATVVKAGGPYMKITCDKGVKGAICFTAPSNGYYSYTELIKSAGIINNAEYRATVRKNGAILDSFSVTENGLTKQFEGYVLLNEGDLLMFAFEQTTSISQGSGDNPHCFDLLYANVTKISDYPKNYKGELILDPVFSNPETLTDDLGLVQLLGYKMNEGVDGASNLYDTNADGEKLEVRFSDTGYWAIIDPYGVNKDNNPWNGVTGGFNLLWAGSTETGIVNQVGGAQMTSDTGSAMVFTAPEVGMYKFDVSLATNWMYAGTNNVNKRYHDHKIMKGDGTILLSTDNVDKGNKYVTNMSITVPLEKGEMVIVTKTPNANSTQMNASCNGSASISITQLDHACTANTLYKKTDAVPSDCINDGTVEYYTCVCGAIYGDANANTALDSIVDPADGHAHDGAYSPVDNDTHKFDRECCDYEDTVSDHNYVEGYCATCDYTCKHVWKDGACTECGATCKHMGGTPTCLTQATCESCGVKYGALDQNNHEDQNGKYTSLGDGKHSFDRTCCESSDIASENCVYGNDNICDKCGYDRTVDLLEDKTNSMLDDYFANEGVLSGEYDVVGPTTDMGSHKVEKPVDDLGIEYAQFNLRVVDGDVILRHHFVVDSNVEEYTVTVGGEEVTLIHDNGNRYYYETTHEIGKLHAPVTIKIQVGQGSVEYDVSVYSYIAVALEKSDDEDLKAVLNALYDLNEAAK